MLKSRNYVKDMLNPVLLQRRHEVQRMLWGNHRIRVPVLDEYRRNSSTHIADRTRPSHQLLLGQPSHLLKHSAQPRAPGRRDTEIQRCSQYRGTDHRTVNIRVTQLVTLQLRDALDECPQCRQVSSRRKARQHNPVGIQVILRRDRLQVAYRRLDIVQLCWKARLRNIAIV